MSMPEHIWEHAGGKELRRSRGVCPFPWALRLVYDRICHVLSRKWRAIAIWCLVRGSFFCPRIFAYIKNQEKGK